MQSIVTHYPAPLKTGSRIAVTAFSSGIPPALEMRLNGSLAYLQRKGFTVVEGNVLRQPNNNPVATAHERASELMQFLLDDSIDAIMPPWGGELAMEVLPLLDFERLKQAKPKWILGYSDISTVSSSITTQLHWASVHCANLMELAPDQDEPLTAALFNHLQTTPGGHFCQASSSFYQKTSEDFALKPQAKFALTETTLWLPVNFAHYKTRFSGRLIGGCLDTLMHLFTSPLLDLEQFKNHHHDAGVILYIENVELPPPALKRALLGLQLKGVFENLNGILIGRNYAKTCYPDAYQDIDHRALLNEGIGDVPYPILMDVDIGHQPPNLTIINGALAEVDYLNNKASLTQWLL